MAKRITRIKSVERGRKPNVSEKRFDLQAKVNGNPTLLGNYRILGLHTPRFGDKQKEPFFKVRITLYAECFMKPFEKLSPEECCRRRSWKKPLSEEVQNVLTKVQNLLNKERGNVLVESVAVCDGPGRAKKKD